MQLFYATNRVVFSLPNPVIFAHAQIIASGNLPVIFLDGLGPVTPLPPGVLYKPHVYSYGTHRQFWGVA
jgi:hypothetical protein